MLQQDCFILRCYLRLTIKCAWTSNNFFLFPDYTSYALTYLFEIVVQVTLVAKGDVPLSILMTVWSTLAAVVLTPLLTKVLAGAYIPVDAVKLSLSTLQVKVLRPIVHNEVSLSE
jgi:hypothetical protein